MRKSLIMRFVLAAAFPMFAIDNADAGAAPVQSSDTAPSSSAPSEPTPEGNGDAQVAADASSADGQKASSAAESASSTEAGSGEAPNAVASDAASPSESDTSSSAQAALPVVDTALSGTSQGDSDAVLRAPEMTSQQLDAMKAAFSAAPSEVTTLETDPTPAVHIDVEDHAEAKERFAGIMARIHRFEAEAIADLKEDLKAIATLLHLHSVASGHAEATGDYKSSDL